MLPDFLTDHQIHETWHDFFVTHWDDLEAICNMLHKLEALGGVEVYPSRDQRFRVFREPLTDVKVVLLGQDPYHGPGQATGLAFSVPRSEKIPPSLRNIFQELSDTFPGRYQFQHGDLSKWASRGVFLLNAALTVRKNEPLSHIHLWHNFTNQVIKYIYEKNPSVVFLLLGNFARDRSKLIPGAKVVAAAHPSPLSAYKGFFGSGVFRRVNELLGAEMDWGN